MRERERERERKREREREKERERERERDSRCGNVKGRKALWAPAKLSQQSDTADPFQEEIMKVVKPFPAERILERTVEQLVDMPVPQIQEQIMEVANTIPRERISERIVEHTRDVPVPQIREQIVEVVKNIHQERISERIAEQTADVTTSRRFRPHMNECNNELSNIPLERISERISEQIVDASVPHGTNSAPLSAVCSETAEKSQEKEVARQRLLRRSC